MSIQYEYRIDDGQWQELGTSRLVTLANLDPGEYEVYARAANPDGVWSSSEHLIRIVVTPPWWETTIFYLVVLVIICGVIYWIYRSRVATIRKQQELRSETNKKIAEIEMKALRAQMNPHFIFNSINSVQSLITKGQSDEARHYLTRFAKLIRIVLNNSRAKFVRLSDDLEALRLYLELERFRFKNFDYRISVGDDIDPHFLEIPPMLLQPYVENAIWHGLSHKEGGGGLIEVRVERSGDLVVLHIIDNGIGRERAGALQTRSRSKQTSLGMRITEDRLSILSELYGETANVQVIDLKDPTGTHIRITLPVPE